MNNTVILSMKKLGLSLLLFSFGLTGCELQFSLNPLEEIPLLNQTDQTEMVMQGMIIGQQAYYQANGSFATSTESLAIDFKLETPEYRYSLITEGEFAQTVVMKAAAKTAELPSYTGVVTVNLSEGGASALANLCKTDFPSTQPPQLSTNPTFEDGLNCPPGSSRVR
ncbi:MAG: type IV pilin-like G/H family protein [Microcoleaceae cyanobacterium]